MRTKKEKTTAATPAASEKKEIQILGRSNLPTVWADHVILHKRTDSNIFLMRLLSELPEGKAEEARVMIDVNTIKSLIDNICAMLNYRPKRIKKT